MKVRVTDIRASTVSERIRVAVLSARSQVKREYVRFEAFAFEMSRLSCELSRASTIWSEHNFRHTLPNI